MGAGWLAEPARVRDNSRSTDHALRTAARDAPTGADPHAGPTALPHVAVRETSHAGLAIHERVHGPNGEIIDFEYRYVNEAGARLLGRAVVDIIGQRVTAVEPRAVAQDKLATYIRVAETGTPEEHDVHSELDGHATAVHLSVARVGTAVAVSFSDMTWRRRAELATAADNAKSERAAGQAARILERMSDAHVTLDREFCILSLNDAAARLFGQPLAQLVGQRFFDTALILLDSDAGRLVQEGVVNGVEGRCAQHVAGTGEGQHLEFEAYPTDDGGVSIFCRDVTARVTADAFQREFTARLGSWNQQLQANVAEREQLLAAAEHARAEAEEANRAKTEFLAVMSHELRTPLSAIGGYAELLALGVRGPVTDTQREDLGRIQRSQRHLLGLINAVLDHARLSTAAMKYEVADVSVRDAAITATALLGPHQLHTKRLSLDVLDCGEVVVARADPEKLQQILVNLLTNAVKFTNPGGAITLRCAIEGNQVAIVVSDTGIGIPEQHLRRIFEPFVQVDSGPVRAQDGVGLGLAISRDLARGMGGDVTAHSEVGVGSTFTLRLPQAQAATGTA